MECCIADANTILHLTVKKTKGKLQQNGYCRDKKPNKREQMSLAGQ